MVCVNDLLEFMWRVAPEEGKEPWDNVGLLVGRRDAEVRKVLVSLDITKAVIAEAEVLGAELIISHHPLIWDTYKFVNDTVLQQEKIMTLIERRIAAICMHTNLDEAEDGVDDTLVEMLGLTAADHLAEGKVGHICLLDSPVVFEEFLLEVAEKLNVNGLRYVDSGRPVQKIAAGCGSCGSYLQDAYAAGCDTFITGDVKHNGFLDAGDLGMNLIDAGHFSTENPIVKKIAEKVKKQFPDLTVCVSETMVQPEQFYMPK